MPCHIWNTWETNYVFKLDFWGTSRVPRWRAAPPRVALLALALEVLDLDARSWRNES